MVQGAFGALLMPNTLALLRSAYPEDELTQAVGVWGSAAGAATAAGPILGGLLVDNVSWQSVFYLNVPVAIATVALGIPFLLESRESHRTPLDWPGVLTLAGGPVGADLRPGQGPGMDLGKPAHARSAGRCRGLLAAFVFVESRVPSPLLPLWLFKDRSVSFGSLIVLLNFFALFGVLFFVSLYLQSVSGYDALQAGIRTLPLTVFFSIFSPLGARITRACRAPDCRSAPGCCRCRWRSILLTSLEPDSAYIHLWPEFILLGIGIGMVISASTEAIVSNVDVDHAGIAGGLQSTAVQLGGVLGTAVLGSLLAGRVGASAVRQADQCRRPERTSPSSCWPAKRSVGQGVAPVPARHLRCVGRGDHSRQPRRLHERAAFLDADRGRRHAHRRRPRPVHQARRERARSDGRSHVGYV